MNFYQSVHDPSVDTTIRDRLSELDRTDCLRRLAAETGIAGGASALRDLIATPGELSIMDRGMMLLHLRLVDA